MMFRYGVSLVARQVQTGQTTPVLKIPMYMLYFSLAVSFGITLITQLMIFFGKIAKVSMDEIVEVDAMIDEFAPEKGEKK